MKSWYTPPSRLPSLKQKYAWNSLKLYITSTTVEIHFFRVYMDSCLSLELIFDKHWMFHLNQYLNYTSGKSWLEREDLCGSTHTGIVRFPSFAFFFSCRCSNFITIQTLSQWWKKEYDEIKIRAPVMSILGESLLMGIIPVLAFKIVLHTTSPAKTFPVNNFLTFNKKRFCQFFPPH